MTRPSRAAKQDPEYLAFLRTLPCFCCYQEVYKFLVGWALSDGCAEYLRARGSFYGRQKSPTEAAHVGMSTSRRGLSQKYPDAEAIALCKDHHTEGRDSIHKLGADAFFLHHGASRDGTILAFQALYQEHCA